jgi:NDP-sugar pyrophosphorylase family protein
MKVIIAMAGQGSRFLKVGITTPKPFIDVKGRWMLEWAIKSLPTVPGKDMIFICLKEHDIKFDLSNKLRAKFGESINIILVNKVTEGQACTVLLAKDLINNDEGLIIYNNDTYIKSDIAQAINKKDSNIKGIISTATAEGDRWSFVKLNQQGYVIEVAEKKRISDHICTGLYYFSHGSDFVWAAEQMIKKNIRVNDEFYVAPVYQEMINRGDKIIINKVNELWEMGTPESLTKFLKDYKGEF